MMELCDTNRQEVMGMSRILIVEDEQAIANLVRTVLTDAGHQCTWAADGMQAADLLENNSFDLALLDIMLPGADGYELLEYCKSLEIPVIFLSAKGDVEDRFKGLRAGAEDYLAKPFALNELLARVDTVLRRCGKGSGVLKIGEDIVIDTSSRVVKKAGQPVALTAKEYDLLVLFAQNQNIVLNRERIYERIWDEIYLGDSRTVDLHVQRMRKKMGLEDRLIAVYKVGYRLEG